MKAAAKKKTAPKKASKASKPLRHELQVDRFVVEYLRTYEGRAAALAAGYAESSAHVQASRLLADPEVKRRIREAHAALTAKIEMTTHAVLERWTAVATADPRELTELHRGACRYCWGTNHLYQRTPREMREAKAVFDAEERARKKEPEARAREFDEEGGVGFNPKRDPNPHCPECFGDGVERVVLKDTRDLSPAAAQLYAGVEQTQRGLKVRMHSQPAALTNIARHLDMFKEKEKAPDGGDMADALRQARERAGLRR